MGWAGDTEKLPHIFARTIAKERFEWLLLSLAWRVLLVLSVRLPTLNGLAMGRVVLVQVGFGGEFLSK